MTIRKTHPVYIIHGPPGLGGLFWAHWKVVHWITYFLKRDFRDYDLGRTCAMYCDKDYEKCVDTCEFNKANDCLMNCGRIFTMCVESCPCHTDCIQGCEGCPNPICYCNVSFDLISQYRIFCCLKKHFLGCLQRWKSQGMQRRTQSWTW